MGRKIPGKKHKGIKDPLEQQAKRNERLKNRINAPPINPDEQEIPKSLLELKRLRQLVADGKFKQKKTKKKGKKKNLIDISKFCNPGPKLPGMIQTDKLLPNLQQMVGESEANFLNRINSATEDIIKEATIENKFNVIINRNSNGSIEEVSSNKIFDKIGHSSKQEKKSNKRKEKAFLNDEKSVKLSRKQRLKLKKRKKKNETEESALELKTDFVKFGEVAHAPPNLQFRPKVLHNLDFEKPGHRNLLLKGIINRSKQ